MIWGNGLLRWLILELPMPWPFPTIAFCCSFSLPLLRSPCLFAPRGPALGQNSQPRTDGSAFLGQDFDVGIDVGLRQGEKKKTTN